MPAGPHRGASSSLILPRLVARRVAIAACLTAFAVGLAACGKDGASSAAGAAASTPKSIADYFPIKVGDKVVRMQLAVRSAEMQRGLMERRDLGPDDGMIFIYEKPQQLSFWMRNSPTALDIGFFAPSGVLEEVYPLHPFDETTVASHGGQLQFALEMNQGWYVRRGIKPGAQLDLKALAAALKARGFEARKYGLGE